MRRRAKGGVRGGLLSRDKTRGYHREGGNRHVSGLGMLYFGTHRDQ